VQAPRSYAVDSLDQREQERKYRNPDDNRHDVHVNTMDRRASRPHIDSTAAHNDFVTRQTSVP
jgi:hypothetical protein